MSNSALRVLLVDDSDLFIEAAARFVDDFDGVQVVGVARNGADGVKLACETRPDLVLMDYAMPDMNGVECAARIRELGVHPRIVIVSVQPPPSRLHPEAMQGIDGFISKWQFASQVREWLCASAAPTPGGGLA